MKAGVPPPQSRRDAVPGPHVAGARSMKAGVPPPQSRAACPRASSCATSLNEGGGATPAIAGEALGERRHRRARSMKAGVPPPQSRGAERTGYRQVKSAQ